MELDITINSNSSGKANITIAATDPFNNGFVDEIIEDIRYKDPQAKIKESYNGLNKVAEIKFSFQDVSELSEYGFYISHNRYDDKHYVEINENTGVPVKLTLNMPGRIISSNGNYSGSRVTWEKAYMSEPYWAESEESGVGSLATVLQIVILVIILTVLILYFWSKKSKVVSSNLGISKHSRYCRNCGMKVAQTERFCANCGHPQEISEGLTRSHGDFSKTAFPVLPLIIAFVFIAGIATVLIIINTSDDDPVAKQTDSTSQVTNELGADYLGYGENEENNSILELEGSFPDGITESESEDEEPSIEYGTISWDGGMYDGQLKDGVPHGYGSWDNPAGKTYVGYFVEGEMTGYGTMVFPGGEKYVGYFLNGKGHGQGVMTHPDGRWVSGTWINGEYKGN